MTTWETCTSKRTMPLRSIQENSIPRHCILTDQICIQSMTTFWLPKRFGIWKRVWPRKTAGRRRETRIHYLLQFMGGGGGARTDRGRFCLLTTSVCVCFALLTMALFHCRAWCSSRTTSRAARTGRASRRRWCPWTRRCGCASATAAPSSACTSRPRRSSSSTAASPSPPETYVPYLSDLPSSWMNWIGWENENHCDSRRGCGVPPGLDRKEMWTAALKRQMNPLWLLLLLLLVTAGYGQPSIWWRAHGSGSGRINRAT